MILKREEPEIWSGLCIGVLGGATWVSTQAPPQMSPQLISGACMSTGGFGSLLKGTRAGVLEVVWHLPLPPEHLPWGVGPGGSALFGLPWRFCPGGLALEVLPWRFCPGGSALGGLPWGVCSSGCALPIPDHPGVVGETSVPFLRGRAGAALPGRRGGVRAVASRGGKSKFTGPSSTRGRFCWAEQSGS